MTIPRQPNRESAPLSYNQQGLWVLNQLMPGTSLYHTPMAVRLTGNLDVAALKSALDMVIARHDALRTTFSIVDGSPTQVVAKSLALNIPIINLIEIPQPGREAEAQRLLRDEAGRPFDLSQGPLIRSVLLRLAEREHILLVTTHHIVTDGWSVGIFHRELSALYEAVVDEQPSSLPQLPIQYTDYSVWQREWFDGDVYQSQLAYWKKQFTTLPPNGSTVTFTNLNSLIGRSNSQRCRRCWNCRPITRVRVCRLIELFTARSTPSLYQRSLPTI